MYHYSFNDERDQMLSLLGRRRSDLQRYAGMDKANPKYIEKENDFIAREVEFVMFIDKVVNELSSLVETTKEESFHRGRKVAMRKPDPMNPLLDKETIRFNSISRALETWPELF
jgi:hypothetical protein